MHCSADFLQHLLFSSSQVGLLEHSKTPAFLEVAFRCQSSCVSIQNQRGPQHPVVTSWAPRLSDFFLHARALVCPSFPASPSSLVLLVNTVVPVMLATQENNHPCGRVHMFAMGVLHTHVQTIDDITITGVMGTQDPTLIPMARDKKKTRNMDPALRTWLIAIFLVMSDILCHF